MKRSLITIVLVALAVYGAGCNSEKPTAPVTPEPKVTQAATETQIPSSTITQTTFPTLTKTPKPTHTQKPSQTPTLLPVIACDKDMVLTGIREIMPYDEFTVSHNTIAGESTLVVWFVDKELTSPSNGDKIAQNVQMAMDHAIDTSQDLVDKFPCIRNDFDVINPIVVDQTYDGWFSGMLPPKILPLGTSMTEEQLILVKTIMKIGFSRENIPQKKEPAPDGSCAWSETRRNLFSHFSPERLNVSFYYVSDESGNTVWSQWDSPLDPSIILPTLMNVTMGLGCLHPKPDRLVSIIVDDQGTAILVGFLPQEEIYAMDVESMQVVYP